MLTPRKIERPPTPAPEPAVTIGKKRSAVDEDEDDGIEVLDGPSAPKRARTAQPVPERDGDAAMKVAPAPLESPRKRQVLEDEGVVLMDGPGEKLDDDNDDVIVLD
jgi:hypothetical protein